MYMYLHVHVYKKIFNSINIHVIYHNENFLCVSMEKFTLKLMTNLTKFTLKLTTE